MNITGKKPILVRIIDALSKHCLRTPMIFGNVAEGTHSGLITRKAEAPITEAYSIVKIGSDQTQAAISAAADIPLGIAEDEAVYAGDPLTVSLLGCAASTLLVRAGAAITAGDFLVCDANGAAIDLPAAPGTYYIIGRALRNAASGGLCEFDPCTPVQRIVA